jgi:hypothetical protein
MRSTAATDSLSKTKAMPAIPVGNMEKSLCIVTSLPTDATSDKRKKSAGEAILLRGVKGGTRGYAGSVSAPGVEV